jgi:hypothetical protein
LPTVQTLVPLLKIGSQVVPAQQSPSTAQIWPAGRQQSPLWQTCAPLQHWLVPQQLVSGGQHNETGSQQTWNTEQHVPAQGAVPAVHSQTQVVGLSTFGAVQALTHVPPHATVPLSQPAQRPVVGSQNLLQHSVDSRHGWVFFRHRVAPAGVADENVNTAVPAAAAK